MIRVEYGKDKNLQTWYSDQMGKRILKKANTMGQHAPKLKSIHNELFRSILSNLHKELSQINLQVISDILLEDRDILVNKYEWIAEYTRICDFLALYSNMIHEKRSSDECKTFRRNYLNRFSGVYLEAVIGKIGKSEEYFVSSCQEFNRLKQEADYLLKKANEMIAKVFQYSMMPQQIRYELYQKMDVSVCPYCGRQYIHMLSKDAMDSYLGDLDHFYPKRYYQLFSLSLWNLLPVCKPCNQLLKKEHMSGFLNPLAEGFDDDCKFIVSCKDAKAMIGLNDHFTLKWEIQQYTSDAKANKIQKNITQFKLDEVYQYHKQDVKILLKKRYLYSKNYFDKINQFLEGIYLSEDEKNCLVYGTSLNRNKFHKEMLGKMTYDVVKH